MSSSSHPSRYALPGLVVPAQIDYGLRGLVSLALATEPRTKIDVLAAEHGLSRKFLAQVLVELRNAGIVSTHRGSDGGYALARRPEDIRIVEVFDAMAIGDGYEPRPVTSSNAAAVTADAWSTLAGALRDLLARITLADLVTTLERDDRTAGGLALDASESAGELRRGGREEIVVPRGV